MAFKDNTTLNKVDTLGPFRHWCQKVLPAVYDDSLSYYELLCKVVDYLNRTMENVNELNENVNMLYSAYKQLVEYVNEFEELVKQRLEAQDSKIKAMERKIDSFIDEMNQKFENFEQEMRTFIEAYTATTVKNEFNTYANSQEFSDILDGKVERALGGSGIKDSLDMIEQETGAIGEDTDEILKRIGVTNDVGGSTASGSVMGKLNALISAGGSGGGGSSDINVESIVQNIGDTADTGATDESGTVFGKLNKIIDATEGTSEGETSIKNNIGSTDDTIGTETSGTLFGKMNTALKNLASLLSSAGTTGDSGGSATAGSLFAKLNKTISDLSTIKSYAITNNTASETGVLSQKLSSIINYVKTNNTANSTGTLSQKLSYLISNTGGVIESGTVLSKGVAKSVSGFFYIETSQNDISLKLNGQTVEINDITKNTASSSSRSIVIGYGIGQKGTTLFNSMVGVFAINSVDYVPSNSSAYNNRFLPLKFNGTIEVDVDCKLYTFN